MTETFVIPEKELTKKEKYELLIPQIKALVEGEEELIANLSNIMAALKYGMDFLWVGIYFVADSKDSEKKELVLGPFQGPVACTRIGFGKGVCGTCWQKKETIIVADVEKFPGHIACSSLSKSEIVLPVFKNNEVIMVLDVDSENISNFDHTDEHYLKLVITLIEKMV